MGENALGFDGFKVLDTAETEDSITVRIEQEKEFRVCSECGSVRCISTGKRKRHFRDIEYKGKFCGIEILATRYRCQDCENTCYPPIDIVHDRFRVTKRFYKQICEECFSQPFAAVANAHGLEESFVRRAFKAYAEELDKDWVVKAPRVLGIDECHLAKEARSVFVEMDKRTGNRLLQMAPDRKTDTVIDVLESMEQDEEHEWPEVVTMDFCSGYKKAVEEVFGTSAKIVIDHFHIQQLATQAVSEGYAAVRKEMFEALAQMDEEESKRKKRRWADAKISVKLFRTNKEDLSPEQKNRIAVAFELWPDFATLYDCKERFRDIFNKNKERTKAEAAYDDWAKRIPKGDAYKSFRKMKRTIKQWRTEVFNFFDCGRVSNGPVEAMNGVIKQLNRMGRGYSYDVIRTKALHRTIVASKPKYKRVRFQEERWQYPTGYVSFGSHLKPIKVTEWKTKKVLSRGSGVDIVKLLAELERQNEEKNSSSEISTE